MNRTILSTVIALAVVCLVAPRLPAQSDNEREQHAKDLIEKANALAKDGQKEAADRLLKQAQALLKDKQAGDDAEGKPADQREQQIQKLGKQLGMLRGHEEKLRQSDGSDEERDKVRRAIAETEKQLAHLQSAGHDRGKPGEANAPREQAVARIRHIRIAAENLKAAGVDDLAQKLMENAQRMEQDLRQSAERDEQQQKSEQGGMSALRQEVERLRGELKEVRAELEKLRQNQKQGKE